jgi:hypothetical protein
MLLRKVFDTSLAAVAYGAGVLTQRDFAIFQDHGYRGLYAGETAADIHTRKWLKKGQRILDHMGSTELAAKRFRITQAEDKIAREGIIDKQKANDAHHDMGTRCVASSWSKMAPCQTNCQRPRRASPSCAPASRSALNLSAIPRSGARAMPAKDSAIRAMFALGGFWSTRQRMTYSEQFAIVLASGVLWRIIIPLMR